MRLLAAKIAFILGFVGNLATADLVWKGSNLSASTLEGSYYEIGKQSVLDSKLPFDKSFSGYFNSMTKRWITSQVGFLSEILKPVLMLYANSNYFNHFVGRIPKEEKQLLKGSAAAYDGYEFELNRVFIGNEMTNVLYVESGFVIPISPSSQCSSFAISGKHTSDGKRIFGRNLDYPGLGYRNIPFSVYLIKPTIGFRHLVVAPTGIPTSGITGMNEKGLTLALHIAFSRIVNREDGTPVISINRQILTSASTIEEALEIIRSHKTISAWMIHLTDRDPQTGKARSAVVEVSAKGAFVQDFRSDGNPTVLANNFRVEQQQKDEYFFFGGDEIHNLERLQRLETLAKRSGQTVEDAAAILRDSQSLTSNEPMVYTPGSIRALDQLASVVFSPDDLKMYVADGIAPASFGKFYEFSFDQMENRQKPNPAINEIPRDFGLQNYVHAFEAQLETLDKDKEKRALKKC